MQSLQGDRGRELGRIRAKANLQNILLANRHERVQLRSRVLFPVSTGGQDDRSRFVDVPLALVTLAGIDAAAVSAPAMTHDFQMKARRASQVGFEGQSFFLLVNAAQQPLYGERPRPNLHGDVRIFEAAGREVKPRMQTRTV